MMYLLHGQDVERARLKTHALIDALIKKKPEASTFRLDAESWTASEMEGLIGGSGLFESNYIIFLDRIFENIEAKEFFLDRIKDIEATPNVFIVLEGVLAKAVVDKINKTFSSVSDNSKAHKIQEFSTTEIIKKEFNNFALADALGQRNKKELWVLYRQAMFEEKAPEELHGILLWQIKSMLQACESRSAQEAGQKPFVYSKSGRYADNFKLSELKQKSAELISIYHDARRGLVDFETELEKFILNL